MSYTVQQHLDATKWWTTTARTHSLFTTESFNHLLYTKWKWNAHMDPEGVSLNMRVLNCRGMKEVTFKNNIWIQKKV